MHRACATTTIASMLLPALISPSSGQNAARAPSLMSISPAGSATLRSPRCKPYLHLQVRKRDLASRVMTDSHSVICVLALKIGSGIEAQVRWPESPGLPQGTAFDRTAPCTAGDKQVRQVGFDQTAIPLSPGGFRTPQRKFDRWHRSRPDWIFSSICNHQRCSIFTLTIIPCCDSSSIHDTRTVWIL